MYPYFCDVKSLTTPELVAFERDCKALGVVNDLDHWYVTEEWAAIFREHQKRLLEQALLGNALAQYAVAVIHFVGYCYSRPEDVSVNAEQDQEAATEWLLRAARQGVLVAIDNVMGMSSKNPELARLRKIFIKVQAEKADGALFGPGETWRRAYGPSAQVGES